MVRGLFESRFQRYEVGRFLVKTLRAPEARYTLNADEYGWVSIDVIMPLVLEEFRYATREHLAEVVEKDAQRRLDIREDAIRVKAGHQYDVKIPSEPVQPPPVLYHGTCEEAVEGILDGEIRKMGKAYVHVTDTIRRARHIGGRKTEKPVILLIDAESAVKSGVRFWRSGQRSPDGEIFLADEIPGRFVRRVTPQEVDGAMEGRKPR